MADKTELTQQNGGSQLAERASDRRVYRPLTDIYESEHGYHVVMDVPGVDKDSVDIKLERNQLTISGRSSFSLPREGLSRSYQEYEEGDFERSFTLGTGIDRDQVTAQARDGVLRVELPKAKESKPRTIEVS